jgi:hypothetical protein
MVTGEWRDLAGQLAREERDSIRSPARPLRSSRPACPTRSDHLRARRRAARAREPAERRAQPQGRERLGVAALGVEVAPERAGRDDEPAPGCEREELAPPLLLRRATAEAARPHRDVRRAAAELDEQRRACVARCGAQRRRKRNDDEIGREASTETVSIQ